MKVIHTANRDEAQARHNSNLASGTSECVYCDDEEHAVIFLPGRKDPVSPKGATVWEEKGALWVQLAGRTRGRRVSENFMPKSRVQQDTPELKAKREQLRARVALRREIKERKLKKNPK